MSLLWFSKSCVLLLCLLNYYFLGCVWLSKFCFALSTGLQSKIAHRWKGIKRNQWIPELWILSCAHFQKAEVKKRSLDLYIKDPSRGNVMQVSFLTRCFSTSVHRIPHTSLPNWLQTYVFSAQISPAMISRPSRSLLWLLLLFWTRFRRTRCTMSSNKHIPWKLPFAPSFWTGVYQTV